MMPIWKEMTPRLLLLLLLALGLVPPPHVSRILNLLTRDQKIDPADARRNLWTEMAKCCVLNATNNKSNKSTTASKKKKPPTVYHLSTCYQLMSLVLKLRSMASIKVFHSLFTHSRL
jgi:hypothetical protein